MVKIDIQAMHKQLVRQGIPIQSVQLNRDFKSVTLVFKPTATDEQKQAAQQIADGWNQEAVDAAQATAFDRLPTIDRIEATKSPKELQAMALELRAFIDDRF